VITGAHAVIFSQDAEADRAFFRDVLGFDSVDAGGGWLIFALPPAEAAVHPGDEAGAELYLMSSDLAADLAALRAHGVEASAVEELRWGSLSRLTLPGGARLGLYQPAHPSPLAPEPGPAQDR